MLRDTSNENRQAKAQELQAAAATRANHLATVASTDKLIDNYNQDPDIKAYRQLRTNEMTAKAGAAQKNGVGDLAMVFAYQRALEPDAPNAVREGEVATARQAVGRIESLKALPKKYISGDGFTEEGRQYILRAIDSFRKSREQNYKLAHSQFIDRAAAFGVDPKLILRDYGDDSLYQIKPGGFFDKALRGGQ